METSLSPTRSATSTGAEKTKRTFKVVKKYDLTTSLEESQQKSNVHGISEKELDEREVEDGRSSSRGTDVDKLKDISYICVDERVEIFPDGDGGQRKTGKTEMFCSLKNNATNSSRPPTSGLGPLDLTIVWL